MKTKKIAFLIIGLVILSFFLIYGNIKFEKIVSPARYINVYLNVSNYSDGWMNGNNIYFISEPGRVTRGSTIIKNNENKIVSIKLSLEGELVNMNILSISKNSFNLGPGKEENIEVFLSIPKDIQGSFSGKIIVIG